MPRAVPDPAFWSGRRVLVTGHTGFKGRWLTLWLEALGAEVSGFSRRDGGDVTDAAAVRAAVAAAAPRGRLPPREPRHRPARLRGPGRRLRGQRGRHRQRPAGASARPHDVQAVIGVTSDKCYLDQGAERPYREDDRLGGYDPYSSSKAAQELVIAAFRDSLGLPVASVRAGNVIGGGDDTPGRLLPDLIRAGQSGEPIEIRAPDARRPWQHVLNPLEGYLLLAERLAGDPRVRHRVQLRPRRGAAAPSAGSPSASARRGRAASTSAPPSTRRATRPRSRASTPPARARGSAGRRRGTSRRRSTSRSCDLARADRAPRRDDRGDAVSSESEAVVLGCGTTTSKRASPASCWASDERRLAPALATQSVPLTAEYRADMERGARPGDSRAVDPARDLVARDVVAVRGRLRVQGGATIDDSRMYWVHRVADGKVRWTASSPDLAGLLADAGLPGRANEAYMAMHGAEDAADALLDEIRSACGRVAAQPSTCASSTRRSSTTRARCRREAPARAGLRGRALEERAAFSLTLNAINFGSGWFPTLRKPSGLSGFRTIEAGLRARGPWTAAELTRDRDAPRSPTTFGQDPEHELMALFTRALRELGDRDHGRVLRALPRAGELRRGLGRAAGRDARDVADVARRLALRGRRRCRSTSAPRSPPPTSTWPASRPRDDLDRLTLFADNLVPHVLRLDGVLEFDERLVGRIDAGFLLEHDSPEEVEIRACALHAVELLVEARPDLNAAIVDNILWNRGGLPRYKARPRHRARTTPTQAARFVSTWRTVSTGIAKPTPLLEPDSLAIWELIPITWPVASSSGPPELPGLIAASVWTTPEIVWPLGDWMSRPRAETTPEVSVPERPNGEPIAIAGWPTRRARGAAERQRRDFATALSATSSTARSSVASWPTTRPAAPCRARRSGRSPGGRRR